MALFIFYYKFYHPNKNWVIRFVLASIIFKNGMMPVSCIDVKVRGVREAVRVTDPRTDP